MDSSSVPYPALPAEMPAEGAKTAASGLDNFVEWKRSQGFLNLPPADTLKNELSRLRSMTGEFIPVDAALGNAREDLDLVSRSGVAALFQKYKYLPADRTGPPLLDALWEAMEGIDVGAIDDTSVSREVKDKIYSPTTDYMKQQARLYNTYQHLIVIPVDYAQYARNPAVDIATLRSFFFGPIGTKTLSSYFAANSFFHYALLEGWISDWVRLPSSPPASQTSGSGDLVRAALQGSTVNCAQFMGPDGTVTQDRATVVIIPPFGGTGATRSHDVTFQWQGRQVRYQGQICFFDCKAPSDATFAIDPLEYNVGTAIHELGHTLFGLPDRYGTSADHYGHDYVGAYDMMSNSGSKKLFNAHDRMKLGWMEPRIIHLGHNPRRVYKMKASEAYSDSAVVIYSDLSPDEYWIVENRSKDADIWGADPGFPQSGLCVWWVNAVDDVIILINQHHAGDKPLSQPQPELPEDPLFNGAVPEAFLFPQWEPGAVFMRKVSAPGQFTSFEV